MLAYALPQMNWSTDMKKDKQPAKVMFQVQCSYKSVVRPRASLDMPIAKDDLEQLIGRYTMQYGTPLDLSNGRDNLSVFEFWKHEPVGDTIILLKFWRIMDGKAVIVADKAEPPPTQVVEEPKQIQALLDANVISSCNSRGY